VSDVDYRRGNVQATRDLLETCYKKDVKRFVYCSSVGVYGKIRNPPAYEHTPCAPESIYDITKLEAEREVFQFHRETGFPVVVIRPAWVYGPGCPRTRKLLRSIKRGRFFLVGDGRPLRHCVYVTDVVEGFDLCGELKRAIGEVYVLADNAAVSIEDLVRKIAATLGVEPPRRHIPRGIFLGICTVVEATFKFLRKEPPLSRRSLSFFTSNTSFDISKARRELGFSPKVSLEDGLRMAYGWILNKRSL